MTPFLFGIDTLSVQDLIDICTGNRTVQFGDEARSKVRKSAGYVEAIVEEGEVVYGINTGFGPLCNTVISKDKTALREM